MARRRHLIAYDISEPRRLRRICKIMEEYGERLQYSVFLCDLSRSELVHARAKVESVMDFVEDSILIIDLGVPETQKMTFIGRRRTLPSSGPRIL